MNGEAAALAGLLASSFLSATILPGNSEVVLAAVVSKLPDLFWTAVAVATIGNTAGGMTSYALGRLIPAQGGRKLAPRAVALAQRNIAAYSRRSLPRGHGRPTLPAGPLPVRGKWESALPSLLAAWVRKAGDERGREPARRTGTCSELADTLASVTAPAKDW